jgi:hypothetical protein
VPTPEAVNRRAASLSAVTQGEYPYPPDEFDAVDPSTGPRGVHRRPRSRWSTVWPFLVALVVSGALAFAVVALVWDDRGPAQTPSTDVAAEPEPEQTPTATPTTEPGATGSVTPEPPATTAPPVQTTPPPDADLDTRVVVFNATTVPGLAGTAAGQLQDAGWSDVATNNYAGAPLAASTVRYGSDDLEGSARAVADLLGIDDVELAAAADGIEVVLEGDFAG